VIGPVRFGGIGGQRDSSIKGTVILNVVVVVVALTEDSEMLNNKLEALPTVFVVRIKYEFVVSPVTFSTGDRVLSVDTCMLPLNDKLSDGNKRPSELVIQRLRLSNLECVEFSVKTGSN